MTTIIKSSIYIRSDTCQLVIHSICVCVCIYIFFCTHVYNFLSHSPFSTYPLLFPSLLFFLAQLFRLLPHPFRIGHCAECQLFLINKVSFFSSFSLSHSLFVLLFVAAVALYSSPPSLYAACSLSSV